jgi:chemotaxis protein CheZ
MPPAADGALHDSVHEELAYIHGYLARARAEIAALAPRDLKNGRIGAAGAQLEAIVRDTEIATNSIMSAAEAVLALEDVTRDAVTAEMMKIFVACSFQDITGQRVRRVVEALAHVEQRVARFADAVGAAPIAVANDAGLQGPGLHGPHTDQTTIDRLFAG